MQRQVVTIPRDVWREVSHDWHIRWRAQSSGASLAGTTKTVYNAFPRWAGTPKFRLVRSAFLTWRAIMAEAQGHVGIYRVPMYDPQSFVRNQNTVFLTTGKGFTTGKWIESTATVVAATAASKGDDTLVIDVPTGGQVPLQGQIMSHGEDWPFVIRSIDEDEDVADRYTIKVAPPLRAAIAVSDEIQHEAVGRFEISDRDFGFPPYGIEGVATVTLPLQEVLTR